jgi:hypothetical protein
MKTIYCKPEDVAKHNCISNFPNPDIRKCIDKNGVQYYLHIVKSDDSFIIEELNESEIQWHCPQHLDERICKITTTNFFPKDLVSGVLNGKYSEKTHLSEKTGWIMSINTGSSSECFCVDRVQNAINLIKQAGYIFDTNTSIKKKIISKYTEKLKNKNATNISISINEQNEIHVYCKFFGNDAQSKLINDNLDIFIEGVKEKIQNELKTTTNLFRLICK